MSAKKPKAAKKVLSKDALKRVKGGTSVIADVTNNKAVTAQKTADKTDAYIRS